MAVQFIMGIVAGGFAGMAAAFGMIASIAGREVPAKDAPVYKTLGAVAGFTGVLISIAAGAIARMH